MTIELARLTTDEVAAALGAVQVAILPIGATEQHGLHLEMRTDTAIATVLASQLARDLGDRALLCPPLSYGLSEHHLAFAGTLTLRPLTMRSLILDIAESLARHGVRRLIIMNGHGGNIDAIRLAAREARRDLNSLVAHLMWAPLAREAIQAENIGSWRHNHACEVETSIALHLDPTLVRTDRLAMAKMVGVPDRLVDPPGAVVDLPIWFEEWSTSGALGDPGASSAERGERIVAAAHENALAFAHRFADGLYDPVP